MSGNGGSTRHVMDEKKKKKTVLQIMEMGKNLFSQMDSHQKVQKQTSLFLFVMLKETKFP